MTVPRVLLGPGIACFGLLFALVAGAACESPMPNQAPARPMVEGPDSVVVGVPAEFHVTVYDADGDQMRVYVAWGDGDTSDYGAFAQSHQALLFEHTFNRADAFLVSARCHDMEPLFSDWSTPRRVVAVNP
jgi:hypothetical protein